MPDDADSDKRRQAGIVERLLESARQLRAQVEYSSAEHVSGHAAQGVEMKVHRDAFRV